MDTCSMLHWLFFLPLCSAAARKSRAVLNETQSYISFNRETCAKHHPTWANCYVAASRKPSLLWWKNSADCLLKHVFTTQSFNFIQSLIARGLQFALAVHLQWGPVFFFCILPVFWSPLYLTCSWGNNEHCWRRGNVNQGNWRQNQSEFFVSKNSMWLQ